MCAMRIDPRRWLGVGAVLAAAGLALALLVAWSGVVNIAASAGHTVFVERFLDLAMTRSVQRHSSDIVPPGDLQSMDRVRVGAAHFAGGCAECHGTPADAPADGTPAAAPAADGTPAVVNPVYAHMLPMPPDLARQVERWAPRELYWIVRHGLQFTGMPEWSGGERPDEVWSVVAFLQKLPSLGGAEYRALASGNSMPSASHPVEALRAEGAAVLARAACDRCHDTPQTAPQSTLVPRLAGQPAAYLERSLREYRGGERRSGFMQPVAAMLSERQIKELAMHYSLMPAAAAAATVAALAPAQETEAALIASGNHPELRLPACLSCHGAGARGDYPVLAGQHANYLAQQLRLWQRGERRQTPWGEVMEVIARRLDATQIDTMARWFAQQPGPGAAE
jgi:cytochrome c553